MREYEVRTVGLAPRELVAAIAAAAIVAAVVSFALGAVVVGVLLLVAAAFLAALYLEQARRRRASSFDRLAAPGVDRTRGFAGFAATSIRTWTRTGREVARLRLDARTLERERARLQYQLGGACYAGDEPRLVELREQMRSCTERIDACAARARDAMADARSRVSEERLAVATTQVREPEVGDPGFEPGTSALSERRSNQLS